MGKDSSCSKNHRKDENRFKKVSRKRKTRQCEIWQRSITETGSFGCSLWSHFISSECHLYFNLHITTMIGHLFLSHSLNIQSSRWEHLNGQVYVLAHFQLFRRSKWKHCTDPSILTNFCLNCEIYLSHAIAPSKWSRPQDVPF